jgi:hypothetical protein
MDELRGVLLVALAAIPEVTFVAEPSTGCRSLLVGLAVVAPVVLVMVEFKYLEPGAAFASSPLPAIVLAGVGVVNRDEVVGTLLRLLDRCLCSRYSAKVGLPPGLVTAAIPLMLYCCFSSLCFL